MYWFDPERGIGGTDPAMLKVVVGERDDQPFNQKAAEMFGKHYWVSLYGSSVSLEGHLCGFAYNNFGIRGGGGSRLPDEVVQQLKDLAANLPDDHKELPPKGHRIVIETMYPPKVQVYDRANLPDEITKILRLMGTTLHPLPPKTKGDDTPAADRH